MTGLQSMTSRTVPFCPRWLTAACPLRNRPPLDRMVRVSTEEAGFAKKAAILEQHIRDCHAHGVLGVADSDDTTGLAERYQEEVAQGNIIDIRSSGPLCRSRLSAADNSATGDFLKIGYSGNIEDDQAPDPRLNPEDLWSILQHQNGRKAVAVANGRQQVAEALAACRKCLPNRARGNRQRSAGQSSHIWFRMQKISL